MSFTLNIDWKTNYLSLAAEKHGMVQREPGGAVSLGWPFHTST